MLGHEKYQYTRKLNLIENTSCDGKLIQNNAETNIKSANMIAAMNFSFKINMCYLIQAKFSFFETKIFFR